MRKNRVQPRRDMVHLAYMAHAFVLPDIGPKHLNTLAAVRNAWCSRGYLIEREIRIIESIFVPFGGKLFADWEAEEEKKAADSVPNAKPQVEAKVQTAQKKTEVKVAAKAPAKATK